MIEVSIPSVEKETNPSGRTRKIGIGFAAIIVDINAFDHNNIYIHSSGPIIHIQYKVEVLFNGRKHFIMRRHSEFHSIHQKLKKILQPPSFPSKRNQNLRTKPLEQRQQELENYLQLVLYQNEVVPQELLDFLQVKHFHSATKICSFHEEHLKEQGHSCQLWHQKVVGFSCDPYLLTSDTSELPDVVVAGVLQGLFPRDTKVSFSTCSKPSVNSSCSRKTSVPSIVIDRVGLSSLPETETI